MMFDAQKLIDEVEQDSFLKILSNIGCDKKDVEMVENLINCFRKQGVDTHSIISALTEFTMIFMMKEGETDDGRKFDRNCRTGNQTETAEKI